MADEPVLLLQRTDRNGQKHKFYHFDFYSTFRMEFLNHFRQSHFRAETTANMGIWIRIQEESAIQSLLYPRKGGKKWDAAAMA